MNHNKIINNINYIELTFDNQSKSFLNNNQPLLNLDVFKRFKISEDAPKPRRVKSTREKKGSKRIKKPTTHDDEKMNIDDEEEVSQVQDNKENDLESIQGVNNRANNLISFSKEDWKKEKNLQTNYAHQEKSLSKMPLNKINKLDDYLDNLNSINKLNNISNFNGTVRDNISTSTRDTMSKKTIGNDYSVTRCEVEVAYNSNLNLNEDKENFNTCNTCNTCNTFKTCNKFNINNNTTNNIGLKSETKTKTNSNNLFYVNKVKNSLTDNNKLPKDYLNPYYLTTHNKIQQNLKIRNSQIGSEERGINSTHNSISHRQNSSGCKIKEKTLYKYFNNKDILPRRLLTEVYFSLIIEESEIIQQSLPNTSSNPSSNTSSNSNKTDIINNTTQTNYIDYFQTIQTDINEKMRAVLIDWLIDVHLKFKLKPETLFLTIDILDKYLSIKYIEQNNLQLLGVTSLWLACKYEEVTIPLIKDCEYITANAYSELQIKKMELDILKTLSYQITFPSILSFFDILAVNFDFNASDYHLGKYFTELFLLDPRINRYKKSVVASSAAYLVMKLNSSRFPEYNYIKGFIMEDERHMKNCAKEICYLIKHNDNSIFQTVKAKYAADEYENISSSSILDLIKE